MDVLTVAAHPDDEILGCGATMARMAAEGADVHILILAEGATSRGEADANRQVAALQEQCAAAAACIGAKSHRLAGLPDNRMDEMPLLDIIHEVERVVQDVQPELIFTHHTGDLNIDHRLAAQATITAARPLPSTCVRQVLSFEILSSSEWAFGQTGAVFSPDIYYDVSDHIQDKQHAMAAYTGELRAFPHPRSPEAIDAQARLRGSNVGVAAAEAFQSVWQRR